MIDKIGIPFMGFGMLALVYFLIRNKSVDLQHFVGSLALFFVYAAAVIFLCEKSILNTKLWSSPLSLTGVVVWIDYIEKGKTIWYTALYLLPLSLGIHWLLIQKGKKQPPSDETQSVN